MDKIPEYIKRPYEFYNISEVEQYASEKFDSLDDYLKFVLKEDILAQIKHDNMVKCQVFSPEIDINAIVETHITENWPRLKDEYWNALLKILFKKGATDNEKI